MPWSARQNKVWRAIEHGWDPPGDKFAGISRQKAGMMADEGVKDSKAAHMQRMLDHAKRMSALKAKMR